MKKYLGLQGSTLATARVLLVVVPSFLLFGYNQSSFGGVLDFDAFTALYPSIDTANTKGAVKAENAKIRGTVVAIYTIGCLLGALFSALLANPLGRRKTLIISAIAAAAGLAIQSSSYSLGQLIAGRIIGGMGVGGVNAIVPVWQAECSKPKNRGKNVVILGTFVAIGISMAAWVNYGLSFRQDTSWCWRLPLALPLIFIVIVLATTFCFPESPRWLVQKDRVTDARRALAVLEGLPENSEFVRLEIDIIQKSLESNNKRQGRFTDLFKMGPKRIFYRACLAFLINFMAQMTGANAITYYATTIFKESLGFPKHEASLLAACVLTWKIFAASFAFMTVDRFGRKPLFMASGAGMSLSMACLAICVSMISNPAAGRAAVFFLFLFMSFFPLGFLGANFLYATEIAPQELRVHFSALGAASHWLFNFVIAEITPYCFASIGYQTYIIYAVIGAFVVPTVYFVFPETNGRSLEDMDKIFSTPNNWWNVPAQEKLLRRTSLTDIENVEADEVAGKGEIMQQHIEKQ